MIFNFIKRLNRITSVSLLLLTIIPFGAFAEHASVAADSSKPRAAQTAKGEKSSNDEGVSDRELLIFAILCYSSEIKEDVTETIKEQFKEDKYLAGKVDPEELKGWKVVDHDVNDDNSHKSGFSVVAFKKNDDVVVAFRGTDGGFVYENWRYLAPTSEHPQAKYAKKYVEDLENASFNDEKTRFYFTGHSLGGYLSLYGTGVFLLNENLEDKFARTATFNGLGLGSHTDYKIMERLYKLESDKLENFRIIGDAVSYFGNHFTPVINYPFIKIPEIPYPAAYRWVMGSHSAYHFFYHDRFQLKSSVDVN